MGQSLESGQIDWFYGQMSFRLLFYLLTVESIFSMCVVLDYTAADGQLQCCGVINTCNSDEHT